jgi:hypothetical protein
VPSWSETYALSWGARMSTRSSPLTSPSARF